MNCPKTDVEVNAVVNECLRRGRQRLPKQFPSIYNYEDAMSDFLYGVATGLKKVKNWERGDPIAFLVQNGIYSARVRRFRALGKRLVILCECGRRLKMSQKPCHGTMETRQIYAAEIAMDNMALEFNAQHGIQRKLVGRTVPPDVDDPLRV